MIMRAFGNAIALTLTVVGAAGGTSAVAQEMGSIINRGRPAEMPENRSARDRGRVTIALYADCLVKRDRKGVEHALDAGYGQAFASQARRLSVGDCLSSGSMSFKADALRGPLFAAMYRSMRPAPAQAAANTVGDWVPDLPSGDKYAGWYQVSSCIVRKMPRASRDLVCAIPASASEDKAISEIVPHLGDCLPGGKQFKLDRSTLSGLLAETVYRIDVTPTRGAKEN